MRKKRSYHLILFYALAIIYVESTKENLDKKAGAPEVIFDFETVWTFFCIVRCTNKSNYFLWSCYFQIFKDF